MIKPARVTFRLHASRLAIFFGTVLLVPLTGRVFADRDQTCRLKSGGQAVYHCPEHYDAVVAGEGTDKCDGSCYESHNIQSLAASLSDIINSRFHTEFKSDAFQSVARRLQAEGHIRIGEGEPLPNGAGFPGELTFRIVPNPRKLEEFK